MGNRWIAIIVDDGGAESTTCSTPEEVKDAILCSVARRYRNSETAATVARGYQWAETSARGDVFAWGCGWCIDVTGAVITSDHVESYYA